MELLQKYELKNASWLIASKVVQMILSFFVGVISTRYLGPGNFGLISYVSAYTTFFSSLCTLGINSVIIKNFLNYPEEQGKTIGTTIGLRAISSFLSALMIVGLVLFVDRGSSLTVAIAILYSLGLLFQVFDTINYWFQSRYQSKVIAVAGLVGYVLTSAYKIVLLILKKDVRWFAFATSFDSICIGASLCVAYKKCGGPRISFSVAKASQLLHSSYHYILSGMMVAINNEVAKFLLKHLLSDAEVGYYALSNSICNIWVFVLTAIVDSMYPSILRLYNQDDVLFKRKNKQLYCMVFYLSAFASLCILLLGDSVVLMLYGKEFAPTVLPLKISTWATGFSYLGVARNAWVVCKGKQNVLKYLFFGDVVVNVILDLIFIPKYGAVGASIAQTLTTIQGNIILPLFFEDLRPNVKLMFEAMLLKGVFSNKR